MNPSELINRFRAKFGYAPTFVARAPGRVNLIGEHTDYNDGFVLPMAIDRTVTFVGAPRTDRAVRIEATNFDQEVTFSLDHIEPAEKYLWNNYIRGVADVVQKGGTVLNGFDAVMHGDVPIASGLSSSAATEMATLKAFEAAREKNTQWQLNGVQEAQAAQRAEIDFVGLNCGIMDQFISSLGKRGQALFIDCRSLSYDLVPMPSGVSVLVTDTQAPRTLASSAYNERVRECAEACAVLGISSLRDISVKDFEANKHALPSLIQKRAAHVVHENQRVLNAAEMLRTGDVAAFGALMNQSHDSLRDLYAVSSKELDAVVNIARAHPGVLGARMTGAGFGGCAIALVRDENVAELKATIEREYPIQTNRTPKVYVCVPSDGAMSYEL